MGDWGDETGLVRLCRDVVVGCEVRGRETGRLCRGGGMEGGFGWGERRQKGNRGFENGTPRGCVESAIRSELT